MAEGCLGGCMGVPWERTMQELDSKAVMVSLVLVSSEKGGLLVGLGGCEPGCWRMVADWLMDWFRLALPATMLPAKSTLTLTKETPPSAFQEPG